MDLSLSKRGDYLVRAAIALGRAAASGEFRKIREVAAEMDLPPPYTPQILNLLVKAGLAESKAGQHGGYRLLKAPAEISLLEIVEASEGKLWPAACTLSGGPCYWDEICAVHPAWEKAYQSLSDTLRSQSLESILAVDQWLAAGEELSPGRKHSRLLYAPPEGPAAGES